MEIDNEEFFRKADAFMEVWAIADEHPKRIPIAPSKATTHTCAYCGTQQSQKECTNCGAPHELKPRAKPIPPPSRVEQDCGDIGDGVVFGVWFCVLATSLLLLSLLIV